MRRAPQRQ